MATSGLHWLDWLIIGVYCLVMIGIGIFFSRKQETTEEYFLAGRSMNWFPIGISLVATLISTISYLAVPGEMIRYGPAFLLGYLPVPFAFIIISTIFIPFFVKLRITSAYEYLEKRFSGSVRTLGSSLFILIRLTWMGVVVYTASLAVAKMAGAPLVPTIFAVGFVATVYTSLGGIQADIFTDIIQFFILFGGALFAVLYVVIRLGGVSGWWGMILQEVHLDYPVVSFDPTTRLSVMGLFIFGFFWQMCTYGSDQIVLQRYLCTRNLKQARLSVATNYIADFFLTMVLALVGFSLLVLYQQHPQLLSADIAGGLKDKADLIFPHFIAFTMPTGLTGFVIAALLAAAMSSLDSGVNSISAVVTVDFYQRHSHKVRNFDPLSFAKKFSFIIGLIVTVWACFVNRIGGNIVEVTNKANGCLVGPLFGIFALGILIKRANSFGVVSGGLLGIITGVLVTYSGPFFNRAISFMWIIPFSSIVTFLVGWLLSFFKLPPSQAQIAGLTYENNRKNPSKNMGGIT
ncbi:MAG: sodium/solute symporter [Candidatus Omnitrophota bacterium]